MAGLRFVDDLDYRRVAQHLFSGPGERFGFLLCRWLATIGGPSLVVVDAILVDPSEVAIDDDGWSLSDGALDDVVNAAAKSGMVLVEAHNHSLGPPGFSATDRAGLEPFASYILDSFPDRPYGATVWADDMVYGEWFSRVGDTTETGVIDRIVIAGTKFQALTAPKLAQQLDLEIAARQMSVFGVTGQQTLGQLRVGLVGLGGTGSHMAQNLAYLGVRDFVLVDSDAVEVTNLNRLVTAEPADVNTPKVVIAERAIQRIAPQVTVRAVEAFVGAEDDDIARQLADVDLIIGCVDDDGPRLLLNRIAVAHQMPYLDVATGITIENGRTVEVGGRVAFTAPGGPCLGCTREFDVNEVRAYFLTDTERESARRHGYLDGDDAPAPAVVSLNGLVVQTAINELIVWIAGIRPPAPRIDIDLLGNDDPPGPRLAPRRGVIRRNDCVECGSAPPVASN